MPSVSGVQLCRLLKSEASTCDVPVILCGGEEPKNRFWAERAGATAYVVNGRTGELMRALERAITDRSTHDDDDGFFTQLCDGSVGIRDRIAQQLDAALFEAVIASEIRALASVGSIEPLFDRLAQFMSQVTRYRYLALATPKRVLVHHHPAHAARVVADVKASLDLAADADITTLADEDAAAGDDGPEVIRCVVPFANAPVATFAIAPAPDHAVEASRLAAIVARELGGAIKLAMLIEDARHLATTDPLTGLANRRAFVSSMESEMSRWQRYRQPLSIVMLDVDYFKRINDTRGHAAGDAVLTAIGELFRSHLRRSDVAARWGGEEFVVAYTNTGAEGAVIAAERLRAAIEELWVSVDGERVRVTASLGVATAFVTETLEAFVGRADAAMYASKANGRNRLTVCAKNSDEEIPTILSANAVS